jgi:hypothetical protein
MGGGQERDRLPHRTDSDSDSNIEKKNAAVWQIFLERLRL